MHSKVFVILLSLFLSVLWSSGCTVLETISHSEADTTHITESAQQSVYLNTTVPKALQEQFAQALVLVSDGQQDQALELFKKIHDTYPNYSGAAVNIAILLLDQHSGKNLNQNQAQAVEYLEIALERQQTNYFAMNRLGVIKRQQHQFKEAAALFTRAVTINKKYALAWYNLGVLNEVYIGKPQAAIDAYTVYLDLLSEQKSELDVSVNTSVQKRIQKRIARLNKKVCEGC